MAATTIPDRLLLQGLIVDQLVDSVLTVTADQRIVVANQATAVLFGYDLRELIGMTLSDLMPERFRAAHREGVNAYLRCGGQRRKTTGYIDVLGLTKSGKEIPMSLSMTCTFHEREAYLTGVLRDMSALSQARETIRTQLDELQIANDRLQSLADQDHLTGVLNRRALQRILPALWKDSVPAVRPMAVVLCDVDHFKQYNDTYGHLEGDNCLMAVAQAIKDVVGESATVARFGGEEFIALLHPAASLDAYEAAEKMREAIRSLAIPHSNSSVGRTVTISIGVAVHADQIKDPRALIRHADDSLYVAKRTRDKCVVWDPMLLGR